MKKPILTITLLAVFMIAFGQKEINSIYGNATMFVNPDYLPHQFSKLLLITGSIDKKTNEKIQSRFAKIGIATITSLQVMPPIKEYSEADIQEICANNKVDGIVKVVVNGGEQSRGKGLVAVKFESQTAFNLEVTLFDIQSNLTAVNFVGTSASTKMDKAIYDYFRAIMEDLKPIILP